MTDVERATALAHAARGDAGTNDLVALLAAAFAAVRADERERVLARLAHSIVLPRRPDLEWEEQLTWS